MTTLANAIGFLRRGLLSDVTLSLAYVAAVLDPLPFLVSNHNGVFADEDDDGLFALDVCRKCFPSVYAQAVPVMWSHASIPILETIICERMADQLVVPPQSLEEIGWGVPFGAMGIEYGADLAEQHPAIMPILGWLGCSPEDGSEGLEVVAKGLINSLREQDGNSSAQDVLRLLEWLTSSSGNSAVDYDHETFWESEIALLDWTLDNVALMNELHQEARELLGAAMRAVRLLDENVLWQRAFITNCNKSRKRGHRHGKQPIRLRWPSSVSGSTPIEASAATEFL